MAEFIGVCVVKKEEFSAGLLIVSCGDASDGLGRLKIYFPIAGKCLGSVGLTGLGIDSGFKRKRSALSVPRSALRVKR